MADAPEPFAKLFDTPDGQLLAFMDETDDGDPAMVFMAAPINGVSAKAILSWPEVDGQQRAFDMVDQAAAEEHARSLRDAVRNLGAKG